MIISLYLQLAPCKSNYIDILARDVVAFHFCCTTALKMKIQLPYSNKDLWFCILFLRRANIIFSSIFRGKMLSNKWIM